MAASKVLWAVESKFETEKEAGWITHPDLWETKREAQDSAEELSSKPWNKGLQYRVAKFVRGAK